MDSYFKSLLFAVILMITAFGIKVYNVDGFSNLKDSSLKVVRQQSQVLTIKAKANSLLKPAVKKK